MTAALVADEWQYVEQTSDDQFARPHFRKISLTPEVSDVVHRVDYRGQTSYARLRYGTANSLRVTIVLDQVDRKEFDLYVDANRDRIIVDAERIPGAGRFRETELAAAVVEDGASRYLQRRVVFRRGLTGRSIAFATVGFSTGPASIDGKRYAARRVDGDGDGLFSSSRDRLWIDLNQDGQWDGFSEQFPQLPVLKIEGQRLAVRGELAGDSLSFQPIAGVGQVRLHPTFKDSKANITALSAMLVGDDGSAVSIQGVDQPVDVPVGTYEVHTVRCAVEDSRLGRSWTFVFSDAGHAITARKFVVDANDEISLDPFGELRFQLHHDDVGPILPGMTLQVQPRLYTVDGLLINSSTVGGPSSTDHSATVMLRDKQGKLLGTTRTGFA